MAGDDEAGSGATTTAETDRPQSQDATTPDAPPSDREGAEEAPSGGDDDPSVDAIAGGSADDADETATETSSSDESATDTSPADTASTDEGSGDDDADTAAKAQAGPGFDVDVAETRLKEVEEQIEEGRRALADVAQETDPEPDGPPIADGEGAANAPPG